MRNQERQRKYRKNEALERVLDEMEELLKEANERMVCRSKGPEKPVLFIVGCARSGTTILHQFLAKSGLFGYPNNLISRFYYAPYIGVRSYQMLYEYDDRNEVFSSDVPTEFASNLGKTYGPSQPHEFWYFWNRFFQFNDDCTLTNQSRILSNLDAFVKEIGTFQRAFDKPLVMKAMNMNWEIPLLQSLSDRFYFLHIERDVSFNAQSLLNARKSFWGDTKKWYSFKTPDYHDLKSLPAWQQTIEQVRSNNRGVKEGFLKIPPNRALSIHYQDLITDSNSIFRKLKELSVIEEIPKVDYSLKESNIINLRQETWNLMEAYIRKTS